MQPTSTFSNYSNQEFSNNNYLFLQKSTTPYTGLGFGYLKKGDFVFYREIKIITVR